MAMLRVMLKMVLMVGLTMTMMIVAPTVVTERVCCWDCRYWSRSRRRRRRRV
jgi:hypothetical protein